MSESKEEPDKRQMDALEDHVKDREITATVKADALAAKGFDSLGIHVKAKKGG